MAAFFGKRQGPTTTAHLYIHAAKSRTEIRVEHGVPMPEEKKPKQTVNEDEWDDFWKRVKVGDSFVVTEAFAQTVKTAASKRGVVTRQAVIGPFKVRLWRSA